MEKARVTIILFFSMILSGFASCRRESGKFEIDYYENGNLKSIRTKEDKQYHGESLWFYPSGMLKQKVIFENGKANGNAFVFYGSGALKTHYYWKNNKQVGFQTDYIDDTVGIITMVKEFDSDGKLIDIRKPDR